MLKKALIFDAQGNPIAQDHKILSNDWDEIKDWSSKVYMPYNVSAVGKLIQPNSTMHSAKVGRITVTRFAYGIPVNIKDWSQEAGNAVVLTTIGGGAKHWIDDKNTVETLDGESFVVDCSRINYNVDFNPDHLQLNLTIPHAVLEQTCKDWLGFVPNDALWQHKCLIGGKSSSWLALITYVASCIADAPNQLAHNPLGSHLEQTICIHLLNEWATRAGLNLNNRSHSLAPKQVHIAEQYMADHAAQLPRMSEVAAAASTSIRSLNDAFQKFRHYTPSSFLRERRLQGVRQGLLDANTHMTVTQIANLWGFTSLGEFAKLYKHRFGELPSKTLRR